MTGIASERVTGIKSESLTAFIGIRTGFFNTDFGIVKNTKITERTSLQFRAEFFNVFNNVNFGQPDHSVADSTVGQIFSAGSPRILQFALKLIF